MKRIFAIMLLLFGLALLTARLAFAGGALGVPDYLWQLWDTKISGQTAGQGLIWNGTDSKWENGAYLNAVNCAPGFINTVSGTGAFTCGTVSGSSGGTVTSVGLSMPSQFTVTGSPVTGSGTLAVTEAAQSCASGEFVNGTASTGANTCATPSGSGGALGPIIASSPLVGEPASSTAYSSLFGASAANGNQPAHTREDAFPLTCTAQDLYVRTWNSQPSDGPLTICLYVNDSTVTSLCVTIPANGAGTYSDTTDTVALTASETVAWQWVNASTSTSATINSIAFVCK